MVTLADALKVITAADKTQEMKWPMNIAGVDEGGNSPQECRKDSWAIGVNGGSG